MPVDVALRALHELRLALSELPRHHAYGPDSSHLDAHRHALDAIQDELEQMVVSHEAAAV